MNKTPYLLPAALAVAISSCSVALGADESAVGGDSAHAKFDAWTGTSDPQWALLEKYCMECHNTSDYAGGVAFDLLSLDQLGTDAAVWEAAIRKLRAGLMPPKGQPRPERAVLDGMVQWLGNGLDLAWDLSPNPGAQPVSRLNRTQYANAVRDLLAFDAGALVRTLPADATTDLAGGLSLGSDADQQTSSGRYRYVADTG